MSVDENQQQLADQVEKFLDGLETKVQLAWASAHGVEPDYGPAERVTVEIRFSEKGFGFGEIVIKQTPKGVFVDTERMGLGRVKKYLDLLLENAITDLDTDPEKHKLYNEERGQKCGEGCPICYPNNV